MEEVVGSCPNCASQRNSPPSVPLHHWPWASRPMQRLHIDFAEIDNLQVLVMIDSHSKWIEAIPMHSATTNTTVNALRVFFASFGLPEQIVSDNGPQFASKEFELLCQ